MSVYRELNEMKMDLEDLPVIPLTAPEERRILKQARCQITPQNRKKKWTGFGLAAVAVCVLSLFIIMEKGAIANMPFIGEAIEKYISQNAQTDYSAYKTAIGETAENDLGRLTLNEVMMDDQLLFLSATFEPADGVEFNYRTHIQPTVRINGQNFSSTGGQSIELNNSMFTVFSEVKLNEAIKGEELSFEISYNTWNFEKIIEQPWKFDVKVSQKALLEKVTEYKMNQQILLKNGETIVVEKVVTTPISTTVYYDLSQSQSEDIDFVIQTAEEIVDVYRATSLRSNEPGDTSYIRFEGLAFEDAHYFLVAYNSAGEELSDPIAIN